MWGTQYLPIKSTKIVTPSQIWWSLAVSLCGIHCTCDVYFCLFNASGFLSKLFSVNELAGNRCILVSRLSLLNNLILVVMSFLIAWKNYFISYTECCIRHSKSCVKNISIRLTLRFNFVQFNNILKMTVLIYDE